MGPLRVVLLVFLLLQVRSAAADEAPPIDDAIQQAVKAGKPLVLEFHAEWCGPCKEFEKTTLKDERVRAALTSVMFVRYDAETPVGQKASARYGVTGFPTFLIIDGDGAEKSRHAGAPLGEAGVALFVRLLESAPGLALGERGIRARLKANPKDPTVRLTTARWLAGHEKWIEAEAMLEALSTDRKATSAQRAEAAVTIARHRRIALYKAQLAAEKVAVIKADPGEATNDDLLIALLAETTSPRDRKKLMKSVVAANRDTMRLNNLAYIALAVGEPDVAFDAATAVVGNRRDAQYLDTLAETHHMRGDSATALRLIDEALAQKQSTSLAGTLRANRERFARAAKEEASETVQHRKRAELLWKQIEASDRLPEAPPDERNDEAIQKQMAAYRELTRAKNELSKTLGKACAVHGKGTAAFIRATLTKTGELRDPHFFVEREAPLELQLCLAKALGDATLPVPEVSREHDVSLTITFGK